MDPELYRRVAQLEKEVRVLLDLHGDARQILSPRDAVAAVDDKGAPQPGVLVIKEDTKAPTAVYDVTGTLVASGAAIKQDGFWRFFPDAS